MFLDFIIKFVPLDFDFKIDIQVSTLCRRSLARQKIPLRKSIEKYIVYK